MGVPLHQLMGWPGPMTHRQFLLWQDWLHRQWNQPNRTDYYLMQLNCTVQRLLAKNPRRIQLKDSLLKFDLGNEESASLSLEEATRRSKASWLGMFAKANVKIRTQMPDGTITYTPSSHQSEEKVEEKEESETPHDPSWDGKAPGER